MNDTIFALATAQGRAGVAVIRISGPDAAKVASRLCGTLSEPRRAMMRSLRDAEGVLLDDALTLWFPGPASFTGEDVVEFQTHGSIAVVRAVLDALAATPDARLAEPGEFTRRALTNGRLDLSQVEGLAALIDAETEAQRVQAQRVLSGAIGERVERWRQQLVRAAALIEATIDFADEDVPVDVTPEVNSLLEDVHRDISDEIKGSYVAERIRTGFEVALVGPPNAGKSTLLNRLAGREAAITSEVAGTTRDVIEVRMDLDGLPVTILDTAGLRDSDDRIENIGISKALDRAQEADIRVFLVESGEELPLKPQSHDILLRPKVDVAGSGSPGVSGKTGQGIPELIERLKATLADKASGAGIATHERHRRAMKDASFGLEKVQTLITNGPDMYDIAADELRRAIRCLEMLVGRVDVENLLDEIFASFCLGK